MDRVERQFLIKIAQQEEEVKNTPRSQSEDIKEVIKDSQHELTKRVEKTLTSGSIYNWIIKKVEELIEPDVKQFVEKNKHKLPTYASNPDALVEDIASQTRVFKYINYLNYALDAAFIVTSITSLAATIFSAGTAGAATIPAEVAKWAARDQLKRFIRKFGKRIITKAFAKKVLKLAVKSVGNVSKHFLLASVRQAGLVIVIDVFQTVAYEASLIALKNVVIKQGAATFGFPKSLVNRLVQAQSNEAFVEVLQNAKAKAMEDLKALFSTEKGFRNLALSAALGKVFEMRGIKSKALKANARASLGLALRDKSNYDARTLKQRLKSRLRKYRREDSEEDLLKREDIRALLAESQIPEMLHEEYTSHIQEEIENADIDDDQRAKKFAKRIIQKKEFMLSNLRDALKDLTTLEVMRENRQEIDDREMRMLFEDVVGHDFSETDLMEYGVTTFDELIDRLKVQKEEMIYHLMERVSLGMSQEFRASLRHFLEEDLELEAHEVGLVRELEQGEALPEEQPLAAAAKRLTKMAASILDQFKDFKGWFLSVVDNFEQEEWDFTKKALADLGYEEGTDFRWSIAMGDDLPHGIEIKNYDMYADPRVKKLLAPHVGPSGYNPKWSPPDTWS